MLAPTLGEHIFLLRLEHRELANFGQRTCQSIFAGDEWQGVAITTSTGFPTRATRSATPSAAGGSGPRHRAPTAWLKDGWTVREGVRD